MGEIHNDAWIEQKDGQYTQNSFSFFLILVPEINSDKSDGYQTLIFFLEYPKNDNLSGRNKQQCQIECGSERQL